MLASDAAPEGGDPNSPQTTPNLQYVSEGGERGIVNSPSKEKEEEEGSQRGSKFVGPGGGCMKKSTPSNTPTANKSSERVRAVMAAPQRNLEAPRQH